ncbi:hypothetical protein K491DRAFT_762650 [Lophiostoma macrostomum CBS 122681]|uniref:Uncharacterized protein n=1 Tax=Lophiostoma macrostomum CBS 122681 TaxID=1314788 RepID=A0A6A6SRP9_9PLEO|nr:hypothetical protein K491DRAFT_762650 [Lophiostoma macrostomum CBS 122681]
MSPTPGMCNLLQHSFYLSSMLTSRSDQVSIQPWAFPGQGPLGVPARTGPVAVMAQTTIGLGSGSGLPPFGAVRSHGFGCLLPWATLHYKTQNTQTPALPRPSCQQQIGRDTVSSSPITHPGQSSSELLLSSNSKYTQSPALPRPPFTIWAFKVHSSAEVFSNAQSTQSNSLHLHNKFTTKPIKISSILAMSSMTRSHSNNKPQQPHAKVSVLNAPYP